MSASYSPSIPLIQNDPTRVADFYRTTLLDDIAPFWLRHSPDRAEGGYFTCLNRDGSRMQDDKSIWFQGRMGWMFARLALAYPEHPSRPQWAEAARLGVEFLERHGFDTDGRMFYSTTRDGRPLRKRRYLFSECFAVIAYAAYGELSGHHRWIARAEELLDLILHYRDTPSLVEPKTNPETRPMNGLSLPMILLVTAQELRRSGGDKAKCNQLIEDSIAKISTFMHPGMQCVLEITGTNGEFLDTLDGRCLNPGHALEAGWFILEEARHRGNAPRLQTLGLQIIDWSLELGWDKEFGGILYFRDAKGLPCTEYWHDMKFWWPQNEAILAALYAYRATGNPVYADWHDRIAQWAFTHFADPEKGEWYGYLHRDGSISTPVKGTMYKGFFHLPRMLMLGDTLCRSIATT